MQSTTYLATLALGFFTSQALAGPVVGINCNSPEDNSCVEITCGQGCQSLEDQVCYGSCGDTTQFKYCSTVGLGDLPQIIAYADPSCGGDGGGGYSVNPGECVEINQDFEPGAAFHSFEC